MKINFCIYYSSSIIIFFFQIFRISCSKILNPNFIDIISNFQDYQSVKLTKSSNQIFFLNYKSVSDSSLETNKNNNLSISKNFKNIDISLGEQTINNATSNQIILIDEGKNLYEIIDKTNLIENKIEDILNNTFFLNYTNASLIHDKCRIILNITEKEIINYTKVDLLLKKFVNLMKGDDDKRIYKDNEQMNNSYIFLLNIKILYYNYLIYSREFTDNSIYHWDIRLDDMMTDSEFLNSKEFNRTEAILIINSFCSRFQIQNNDYNTIDFKIRYLIQTEYENEMFNRPELSEEDKEEIRKIICIKQTYKLYLQEKKTRDLEDLDNKIGMEMILNDTEYLKLINASEWKRIIEIGRNFTNNNNLSQNVNWKEFDGIFQHYKTLYSEEIIVNDDIYIKFKEVAIFESNYYNWKKNKIENPVHIKKVKTHITTQESDSLFSEIGKNLHGSLQPMALSKIRQKTNK